MTGKPTPGRCEVLTAGSSVYVTKDGVPIAKVSSLHDSEALAQRFVVGWNAIVDAETAGYDGPETLKALPGLVETLKRFITAVGRDAFDPPGDESPTLAEVIVEADTLLDRLTKKGDTDDAA